MFMCCELLDAWLRPGLSWVPAAVAGLDCPGLALSGLPPVPFLGWSGAKIYPGEGQGFHQTSGQRAQKVITRRPEPRAPEEKALSAWAACRSTPTCVWVGWLGARVQ